MARVSTLFFVFKLIRYLCQSDGVMGKRKVNGWIYLYIVEPALYRWLKEEYEGSEIQQGLQRMDGVGNLSLIAQSVHCQTAACYRI